MGAARHLRPGHRRGVRRRTARRYARPHRRSRPRRARLLVPHRVRHPPLTLPSAAVDRGRHPAHRRVARSGRRRHHGVADLASQVLLPGARGSSRLPERLHAPGHAAVGEHPAGRGVLLPVPRGVGVGCARPRSPALPAATSPTTRSTLPPITRVRGRPWRACGSGGTSGTTMPIRAATSASVRLCGTSCSGPGEGAEAPPTKKGNRQWPG